MSLSQADRQRIEQTGRGADSYFQEGNDGYWRLRNVDGHCVFLEGGHCLIYPHRPEGCVLYPLIYYTDTNEPGLDDFCPYRYEFRFSQGDREWLSRSIHREEAEVAARRRPDQEGSGASG